MIRHFLQRRTVKELSVKKDVLSMTKSHLVKELCRSQDGWIPFSETESVHYRAIPLTQTANLLEQYMLLHSRRSARSLLYKFECIDPDKVNQPTRKTGKMTRGDNYHHLKEVLFLKQFASLLHEAGYEEIHPEVVERHLKSRHIYNKIEYAVNYKDYLMVRIWIKGRKEQEKEFLSFADLLKPSGDDKEILHDRAVVASRSMCANNMILKGFKNVPLGHFELLLPETKINRLPKLQRWMISASITIACLATFIQDWMGAIVEFRLGRDVLVVFVFWAFYKFSTARKEERKRYAIAWKRMLYHRSTANNAGLVHEIINRACVRSLKSALVVYGSSLQIREAVPMTEDAIKNAALQFLSGINKNETDVKDLDFSSSFTLLRRLGLFETGDASTSEQKVYHAVDPEEASRRLMNHLLEAAAFQMRASQSH